MEIKFINESFRIYHSIRNEDDMIKIMMELEGYLINPTKNSLFSGPDAPIYQNDFITKLSIEECRSIVRNKRWQDINSGDVILIMLNKRSVIE